MNVYLHVDIERSDYGYMATVTDTEDGARLASAVWRCERLAIAMVVSQIQAELLGIIMALAWRLPGRAKGQESE